MRRLVAALLLGLAACVSDAPVETMGPAPLAPAYLKDLPDETRNGLVDSYRRRMYYYEPYDMREQAMVMSIEELATIFHIPSRAVQTPTLARVPSATGEAPANLPI